MAFARLVLSMLAVATAVIAPSSALAGDAAPPSASMPARPPVINGAIRGTVELTGKVPPRTPLRRDSDPVCAAVEKQSEDIIATKGKLAGVLVRIKNADPTSHNVRATRGEDYLFNLSQPARAPDLGRDDVTKPGEVVSLHCDVHPWMNAFVVVQDHAFFAVTGEDGRFELPNVPPGTYQLEAWHPVLGLRSTKVKVAAKPVTAKLRFAAPKKAAATPI